MSHLPRPFKKLLAQHGLREQPIRSGHRGIFNKQGQIIYRCSGSPKNMHEAIDNNIKDLVRIGALPQGVIYQGKVYNSKRQDEKSLQWT